MNLELLFNSGLRNTVKVAKILTGSDKKTRYIFIRNNRYYCSTTSTTYRPQEVVGKVIFYRVTGKPKYIHGKYPY